MNVFRNVDNKTIGGKIRSLRQKRGMSVDRFAEEIALEPYSLRSIEAGRRGASLNTLFHIAQVLDVSVDSLIEGLPADDTPYADSIAEEPNKNGLYGKRGGVYGTGGELEREKLQKQIARTLLSLSTEELRVFASYTALFASSLHHIPQTDSDEK